MLKTINQRFLAVLFVFSPYLLGKKTNNLPSLGKITTLQENILCEGTRNLIHFPKLDYYKLKNYIHLVDTVVYRDSGYQTTKFLHA